MVVRIVVLSVKHLVLTSGKSYRKPQVNGLQEWPTIPAGMRNGPDPGTDFYAATVAIGK